MTGKYPPLILTAPKVTPRLALVAPAAKPTMVIPAPRLILTAPREIPLASRILTEKAVTPLALVMPLIRASVRNLFSILFRLTGNAEESTGSSEIRFASPDAPHTILTY